MPTKEEIKSLALKALPYAALLAIGVGIGWGVKPTQVRTEEKVKLVEVEKKDTRIDELLTEVQSLKTEISKAKTAQVDEKYHKEVVETTDTTGAKTKKTTIDKNVDSHTVETEVKTQVQVVTVEKQVVVTQTVTVEKEVTKEKIVTPVLTQWHFGALVGVNPQLLPIPNVNSYIFGAEVEHRFIGPIYLGVWGMGSTAGQGFGGVKIGMDF
jgi:hypothetical protein